MSDIKSHIPVVQDPLLVSCPGSKGGVLYVFGEPKSKLLIGARKRAVETKSFQNR